MLCAKSRKRTKVIAQKNVNSLLISRPYYGVSHCLGLTAVLIQREQWPFEKFNSLLLFYFTLNAKSWI